MVGFISHATLDDIAQVIQLAIAPVFLLTAVGTLLVVLTNRLGRAVDRRRVLEDANSQTPAGDSLDPDIVYELSLVERRVGLIYHAIASAVLCALFICLLIATAFADAFLTLNLANIVGALFVLAMLALIAALLIFLREIVLGVKTTRHGAHATRN